MATLLTIFKRQRDFVEILGAQRLCIRYTLRGERGRCFVQDEAAELLTLHVAGVNIDLLLIYFSG